MNFWAKWRASERSIEKSIEMRKPEAAASGFFWHHTRRYRGTLSFKERALGCGLKEKALREPGLSQRSSASWVGRPPSMGRPV